MSRALAVADLVAAGAALVGEDDDPWLAEFRRLGRDGVLRFQQCGVCGYLRYPPAQRCPECLATDTAWVADDGPATVWSVAIYHRAYAPQFAEMLPYAVVLAELDSGPRLISTAVGLPAESVRIGQRGTLRPIAVGSRGSLIYFHAGEALRERPES